MIFGEGVLMVLFAPFSARPGVFTQSLHLGTPLSAKLRFVYRKPSEKEEPVQVGHGASGKRRDRRGAEDAEIRPKCV